MGFAKRFHPSIVVRSLLEKEASLLMVCAFVGSIFVLLVVRTQFAHIPFASSVRLVCVDVQSVHRGSTPKT